MTDGVVESGVSRGRPARSARDRDAPVVQDPADVRDVLDARHVLLRPGYLRCVDDVDREGVVDDEELDFGPDALELGTAGRERLELLGEGVEGGAVVAAR